MAGESHSTTDQSKIKSWAEQRGGRPAVVKATHNARAEGLLRIDFPDYSGEQSLDVIDWDEFFEIFSKRDLEFLYQDKTREGSVSRFCKFVARRDGPKND